ncbi:hypothetical protein ABNX05_22950 [Lysinibacillus sp. M3]|uniref:Uncharacterized protein n=1 Tax=Lysinibacillus zambalensis TaxID=3160866 RepID=A0ABV1MYC8_9BACI
MFEPLKLNNFIVFYMALFVYRGYKSILDQLALKAQQERSDEDNQLCFGIIASGIGFVLAQRTPFRLCDIRQARGKRQLGVKINHCLLIHLNLYIFL